MNYQSPRPALANYLVSIVVQTVSNAQVDYVFEQLKITGWPHAFAVTLATVAIWHYQPNIGIIIWFFVLQIGHILRVRILDPLWVNVKSEEDYQRLRIYLAAGMFTTGCLWAIIPAFYLNDPHAETFVFISIALAGMISATLPALAAYLPSYLCFVTPLFAALIERYYALGMGASALLTVSFLGAMVGSSYVINRVITRSITMDFKNKALLLEVTCAKEKAEEANQAKSKFLAAASHDLRQPLQALGLILESVRLRVGKNEANLQPLVYQCLDAHSALSELLNSLLELSRLESHELDVQFISIPIKDVVNSIVSEFQQAANLKGLTLSAESGDFFVRTDAVLFGRVLRNLLSNAIKFTPKGNVEVVVTRVDHEILLSVTDTGLGISSSEQEKIFDEYYQVSNSARNRGEGTGLGLSIVKKICQLLGHSIQVHSIPGQGTTFSIRLPIGFHVATPTQDDSLHYNLEGYRVLILDDDPSLLLAVSTLMDDWKCDSLTAETIEMALEKMQQNAFVPDVILSDYRLGENVNGIDAINAIRKAVNHAIPAIFMSGDTDPALVKQIREQKYFLLHKPVKPVQLRKSMSSLLAEKAI